jgi:hypothetical protein
MKTIQCIRANSFDCPGEFVPHHQGFFNHGVTNPPISVGVQIGTTDTHSAHSDHYFAALWGWWHRKIFEAEITRTHQFNSAHDYDSPGCP